jgi:PAS domain S-box-containing protein
MILDMRTMMLMYAIANIVCALVMTFVWYENRKHFAGISFWLADLVLQAGGATLIVLRGLVPDFVSMVVANTMILAGIVIIYIGLERFLGKRSSQVHNYVLLAVFISIATYFTLIQPNLEARSLNISVMTVIFTFQCFWLMVRRVAPYMRQMTRGVGIVFGGYALIGVIRIARYVIVPLQSNDFFKSGTFETLMITFYIILAVGLICGLILMVNRRLLGEVQASAEQIRRERDRAQTYFNIAGTMLLAIDADGKVSSINEKGCNILEYDRQDIIGKNWFNNFLPERMRADVQSIFRRIMKGEIEPFEHVEDFAVLSKSGKEKLVSWHNSVIKDEHGKIIGTLSSGEDITERKRMEEERKELEQKAQLSSRLASIGELASGVAHEINNPLTGIIGYAQFLLAREDIPEDVREDLKIINEGAQRVSSIVRRLSAFARQTKPQRTHVDINGLISSVLQLRAYDLSASNVQVTADLAPDLPITTADAGQLQQVFLNLITNAEMEMKLAHGKGKLIITTKKSNNTIKICFQDNGPGIKPEVMDKIFDPFFTTRKVGEGTGLGLSLCYGIVAEHKGKIYAESQPGKGATFIIELPVVTEVAPPKPAEPVVKKSKKAVKARILVVDDEQVVRDVVNRVLTGEGHKVDTVDNAADALKKIESKRYSLILVNIKMPGMDGVELYKRIQKIARSLARRVVFITGDIVGAANKKFLSETKAAHIDKPFDAEQLSREVKRALTAGR